MPLGVVVLDLGHRPVPGMVAHPASHPAGTPMRFLTGPDLVARAVRRDPDLLDDLEACGRELVAEGATAVATSCGYFTAFQVPLADRLGIPVFSSPLMQLPSILAGLPTGAKTLVVGAVASGLDAECFAAAGVSDLSRVEVIGVDGPGHFRDSILEHHEPTDALELSAQLADVVRRALPARAGAVLLECGEMPVAAAAVRQVTTVPVYDYATYLAWARATLDD